LDEDVFPSVWKICSVTPVLKSSDPSLVTSYRSISISPHIAKIFKSIIFNYLGPKLNNILIPQQHGVRTGRSTISYSVSFSSFICDYLSSGAQVDVIFTDFSKAFDTVPHNLLINELDRIDIGDPLLSLFRSYLSGRKQFVKLNGVSSGLSDVTSGVPRGGHLNPLLFCLYVNSISSFLKKAHFLLYADDIKIFL